MRNSTFQSTTKQSPAEIVFGKKFSKEWCNVNKNVISLTNYEENRNRDKVMSYKTTRKWWETTNAERI